ncbi:MAG: dienelactone hydrolase family protein [Acetobacterales bacterium]
MSEPRLTQDIINLYDEYTHAPLARRVFLDRLAMLAGGTAAAYALLPLLENNYARAEMVAEGDARLEAGDVKVGEMSAYVVRPKQGDEFPAVLVIHENRGLNPYIRDVARRVALAGYVAVAPDFLSSAGGTPADEDKARDMIGKLDAQKTLDYARVMAMYARTGRADVSGNVGAVGFCWGGGLVNQLAVHDADLNAAVAFYGRQPKAADAEKIKAPVMLQYAGLDERINAGIVEYVDALKAAKVEHTVHMYEGVNHAFHNDTNAARYNADAAKLAWDRTIAFFDKHLKA